MSIFEEQVEAQVLMAYERNVESLCAAMSAAEAAFHGDPERALELWQKAEIIAERAGLMHMLIVWRESLARNQ